jgi:hypothetical protein
VLNDIARRKDFAAGEGAIVPIEEKASVTDDVQYEIWEAYEAEATASFKYRGRKLKSIP